MKDGALERSFLKIWFVIQETYQLHRVRKQYKLSIMPVEKTIEHIKQSNCSVSRYGDGEFDIMLRRSAPGFQKGSNELSVAMQKVFENRSGNLLICIPGALFSTKGFTPRARKYWEGWSRENLPRTAQAIRNMTDNSYCFGDAYISRPYSAYKSAKHSQKIFTLLKGLWKGRDVLFVEGAQTRLGVGNDLFSEATSIRRILCPAENAFNRYPEIKRTVLQHWQGELVIMALGPTATILASDLSQNGIQALDLGHIDIQYEWYLKADKNFTPVTGKYTNEAVGGQCAGDCKDKKYLSQIVAVIE